MTTQTTATVKDFRNYSGPVQGAPNATVKVGDWVGFKADVEQSGEIVRIERDPFQVTLVLRNQGGFEGEYIGGETETTVRAEDCWL